MADKYINPQGLQTIKTWVEGEIPTKTSDLTNDSDFQTSTDVATAISGKLNISGGTMTGTLTLSGAPTNDLEASTKKYVDDSISSIGSGLPSQSGNSGKFLTTDGTDASWATVPTPPSAYTSNPEMNGVASAGSSSNYAKGDHVHPTDTSRQANITASGILKGNGSGTITAAVAGTDYQTPLPTQTGNNGKFLTTDGSNLSWGTPSGGGGGGDVVKIVYDEATMSVEDLGVAVKAVCDAGKIPVIDDVGTVIYLSSSTSEEGYFSAMFVGFSLALDSGTLTTAGIAGLALEYSEGDGWTLDDGYSDVKLSVR